MQDLEFTPLSKIKGCATDKLVQYKVFMTDNLLNLMIGPIAWRMSVIKFHSLAGAYIKKQLVIILNATKTILKTRIARSVV